MPVERLLGFWLMLDELAPSTKHHLAKVVAPWLDRLAAEVERPRPDFYRGAGIIHAGRYPVTLPAALRERGEAIYLRLWHSGGAGKHSMESELLSLLAYTADPRSLRFWSEVFALGRAGDSFASKRRELVADALALTAARHPSSGALDMLGGLARGPHAEARAGAVDALCELAADEDLPVAEAALEMLRHVAVEEPAFMPRFLARRFLASAGEPPPDLDPDQVVAFEVSLGGASRTIELGADQTLADLHYAILDAFGWDVDHLHEFTLSRDRDDERFTIPARGEAEPPYSFFLDPDDVETDYAPSEEASFALGAMDLPAGYRFTYLYDFGDWHLFEIRVAGIHPRARRARYPRVTARVGRAPQQYGRWSPLGGAATG